MPAYDPYNGFDPNYSFAVDQPPPGYGGDYVYDNGYGATPPPAYIPGSQIPGYLDTENVKKQFRNERARASGLLPTFESQFQTEAPYYLGREGYYTGIADQSWMNELQNGGYTPAEQSALLQSPQLSQLYSSIDPLSLYQLSPGEFNSYFLTPDEQAQIQGDPYAAFNYLNPGDLWNTTNAAAQNQRNAFNTGLNRAGDYLNTQAQRGYDINAAGSAGLSGAYTQGAGNVRGAFDTGYNTARRDVTGGINDLRGDFQANRSNVIGGMNSDVGQYANTTDTGAARVYNDLAPGENAVRGAVNQGAGDVFNRIDANTADLRASIANSNLGSAASGLAIDPSLAGAQQRALGAQEANVRGAIDPTKLTLSQGFTEQYPLTDAEINQMSTLAGRTAASRYNSAIDQLGRYAAASGGIMGLSQAAGRGRLESQAAGDAAFSAAQARLNATAQQREQMRQAEQMRLGAEQNLAQTKIGSELQLGQSRLSTQQGIAALKADVDKYRAGLLTDAEAQQLQAELQAGGLALNANTEASLNVMAQRVGSEQGILQNRSGANLDILGQQASTKANILNVRTQANLQMLSQATGIDQAALATMSDTDLQAMAQRTGMEQQLMNNAMGAQTDIWGNNLNWQNQVMGQGTPLYAGAMNTGVGMEQGIGNNNIDTSRYITGAGMNALGQGEQAQAGRAQTLGLNRQGASMYGGEQGYNRGMGVSQEQFNRGSTLANMGYQRASDVANTRINQQNAARGYYGAQGQYYGNQYQTAADRRQRGLLGGTAAEQGATTGLANFKARGGDDSGWLKTAVGIGSKVAAGLAGFPVAF